MTEIAGMWWAARTLVELQREREAERMRAEPPSTEPMRWPRLGRIAAALRGGRARRPQQDLEAAEAACCES
jgi:hypothetical protein